MVYAATISCATKHFQLEQIVMLVGHKMPIYQLMTLCTPSISSGVVLSALMAEFDARFKADYFYTNGTLDKKAYLDALVDCFNYKWYADYYAKNETGKDLFDPKDLTPLIDQNFVNYDVDVVLEQIKQKRSKND